MNRSLLLALLIFGPPLLVWADTQYNLRVDGMACPYCAYGIGVLGIFRPKTT